MCNFISTQNFCLPAYIQLSPSNNRAVWHDGGFGNDNDAVADVVHTVGAVIGSNVRLVNERGVENEDGPDGMYYIRDGIVIIPKTAVVPNGTVI